MAQKLRAIGVARMLDNDQGVLVCFDRKPTDDELRDLHDTLAGRRIGPSAGEAPARTNPGHELDLTAGELRDVLDGKRIYMRAYPFAHEPALMSVGYDVLRVLCNMAARTAKAEAAALSVPSAGHAVDRRDHDDTAKGGGSR